MQSSKLLAMVILVAFLAACGGNGPQIDRKTRLKQQLETNLATVNTSVDQLTNGLRAGTITNAVVLKSYAAIAVKNKPQFADIINVLASEGTVNGPTYLSIKQRLDAAKTQLPSSLETVEAATALNEELDSIVVASQNYDAMLVDAINVLADFTDGDLPKMRELEYEGETPPTASSAPVGSEYVGNSNYGQWKQNSSGQSFWAFYGQYAMFSRLFSGPTYYDRWSSYRRPSYYHDYGRGAYSSPTGRSNQSEALQRTKKQYTSQGKSFKSSYARKKPTIKGAKPGTKPVFKSSYTRASSSGSINKSSYSKSTSKPSKSSYNSRSSSSGRSSFGGGK